MKRIIKILIAVYYQVRYWTKCKIHVLSSTIINDCVFEGKNFIGKNSYINGTYIGYGTFLGRGAEFCKCKIGRFCSIGNNVRVISATHPTNMASSHPAFYSDTYHFHYIPCSRFCEHLTTENGFECEIGNDVWIGDNVLIKGGLKIGNGAIIGMGSIVLHDVEPYTIVAGIPATQIRKRFPDEIIRELQYYRWWDMPLSWISKNADSFISPETLISKLKR